MRTLPFEILWLVPLLPVVVALLLLPTAARMARGIAVAATLLAWLGSLAPVVSALLTQLDKGEWGVSGMVPFNGVRLIGWDAAGVARLSAGPLEVGLAFALALGAGVALLGATQAWGGGARASARPLTGGQLLLGLLSYGAAQLVVLSSSLLWVVVAASVTSVAAWGILAADEPKRAERDAAGHWLVMLRVGDAAWLLAAALAFAVWGDLELKKLAAVVPSIDPWARAATGALAGYPAQTVRGLLAGLLLFGAATRVPALPLPFLYRTAVGAPAPALALVHVAAAFFPGVVVVLRTAPLWWTSPLVISVATWAFAGAAFVSALSALNARDVLKTDLHMLHTLAALAIYAALAGQIAGAFLLALLLPMLAPALLAATGAVIEALLGRLDVFEMGGLWKAMRWTDRVRSLATLTLAGIPGFGVWLAMERTVFEGLYGARVDLVGALLAACTVPVLSLAAFRTQHLVYSGDAPREDAPAVIVEVPLRRFLPPMLIAFGILAAAGPLTAPLEIVQFINPNMLEALPTFLLPSLRELLPEPVNFAGAIWKGRAAVTIETRFAIMAVVGVCGLAGYVLSALFYRKGPTALHARLAALPLVERIGPAASGLLGAEHLLLDTLSAAFLRVARVVVTLVLVIVIDGLITRVLAFVGAAARTALRFVHNGDVQRALLLIVGAVGVALWFWRRT